MKMVRQPILLRLIRAVIILMAGLIVLTAGLLAWSCYRNPAPAVISNPKTPEGELHIGDLIPLSAVVECPLYRIPSSKFSLTESDDDAIGTVGKLKRRLQGISPTRWRWTCTVTVQPYDLGPVTPGTLRLPFTPNRNAAIDSLPVQLPKLEITPRQNQDNKLELATPLASEQFPWLKKHAWALGSLLIISIIALALWHRRSRPPVKPPVAPPWETASKALQNLQDCLPMEAEAFFVDLTDVVRDYLEKRFNLPASGRTTPEFLARMQSSDQLTTDHRLVLTQFLTAADMIKFARASATQQQLEDALAQARRFVTETIPQPSNANGETTT